MLRTRLLTAIVLVPIVVYSIYLGGLPFLALVGIMLTLAEIEFCRLTSQNHFRPALAFGIGVVWLFMLDAGRDVRFPALALEFLQPGMTALLLGSLTWHLLHRGESPVADWGLTVTGGLYLGLCGAAMIKLRGLQDGTWWTLTALPAAMLADTGAYFVGRVWGRHKLAPAISPGKTWEGYAAGVVTGGLTTALLASLWRLRAGPGATIGPLHGLFVGLLIGALSPLGDLAVSMIKREAGAKDSGTLIPGHGGALDRLDSLLWAAVIGYYYVSWFAF